MNSYELSRKWFDFCFENPEKITTNHTALYFFIIEHCNRLGWKAKFGLPSQMAMDAIGIKNWRTYSKALNELIDFGFVKCIQKSKNQYSATVIAIVKNTKATTKALDKAMQTHDTKQSKSTAHIVKPNNLITIKPNNIEQEDIDFLISLYPDICEGRKCSTRKGGDSIKAKLKKILSKKSKEEVEASIKDYVGECQRSKTYLMNFSKFLDELPEPSKKSNLLDDICKELNTTVDFIEKKSRKTKDEIERYISFLMDGQYKQSSRTYESVFREKIKYYYEK
jgi:DNA-binding transcriptional regulator YhcF (GntR family)